ncbi:MFS transporter [Microbacterium yannicii]|uniref:MFS transporter n=1 Tax=Microbacterium yannicii TaxID=671622 RepID=UPI0003117FB1|nr:MFS transporter [Microbacterium yannicii]
MATEAPTTPEAGHRPDPDVRKLRPGFIITFFLANMGLWIATLTPVIVTLPLKVTEVDPDPATQALTLSLVLIVGSVVGIISNPVAGRLSDRTTSRMGMRRPWLLIGAALTLIGMIFVASATSVGPLILGWVLAMVGTNTMMAVLIALLPDHVPHERRGLVSGLLGVGQALAAMIGAGLAFGLSQQSIALALIVPAVIAAVFMILACVVLKDRHLDKADRPPFNLAAFVGSFWVNPRKHPDFAWAWWSRFAIFMAISMVLNYQLYFLVSQIGLSQEEAIAVIPAATAAQTITVVIVSLIFGPLSDRLRRRKMFVLVSAIVAAVGLGLAAFSTSIPTFLVAMVLVGLGQGVYFAVDLALVTDILPNRAQDAAKNMGVFNLANVIPQTVAPAVAPLFLLIPVLSITGKPGQNYTALFIGGAIFAVVAGLSIWKVRGVR